MKPRLPGSKACALSRPLGIVVPHPPPKGVWLRLLLTKLGLTELHLPKNMPFSKVHKGHMRTGGDSGSSH